MVSEAVSKYSKVKSIGLCNVPVSMQMMIAEMMACEPQDLQLEFAGLNHLVWVHQAWLPNGCYVGRREKKCSRERNAS
ncbi:6-phospho-beta-glucosidase [Vibrio cholerae]|nr:6-phospho-beta-glucosidase [Vibrio cholerae]